MYFGFLWHSPLFDHTAQHSCSLKHAWTGRTGPVGVTGTGRGVVGTGCCVCTQRPPWHWPFMHISSPFTKPMQLPPGRIFAAHRCPPCDRSQNRYLEPQFGPAAHVGRGAYSYRLSVYLLLRPSMLFHGSNGRIRAEPKCCGAAQSCMSIGYTISRSLRDCLPRRHISQIMSTNE